MIDKECLLIDISDNIDKFIKKESIAENIDIKQKIEDIVKVALNIDSINVDQVTLSIQTAKKQEIKSINKEYRNVDKSTDVLSFPIFDKLELEKIKIEKEENKKIKLLNLGDIILCLDVIKEQSIEYNTGIIRELLYMITHGVCHLLGFDHEVETDKKDMRKIEEEILNQIGVCKTNA